MPTEKKFYCIIDLKEYLTIYLNDNDIAISIKNYDQYHEDEITNTILLSKSDIKNLIKELNILVKTKDKIYY
jgi:hypothetical protein